MKIWKAIPNALTLTRLLLCPLVVYLFLREKYLVGLGMFLAACITDFLDGYIARRFKATSTLGELLDPVCDKLFSLSFFSLLMVLGSCPSWFMGLLIAVNLLQCLGWLLLQLPKIEKAASFSPSRAGKINMVLQFLWIGVLFSDIFLRHQFPRNFRFSWMFHMVGYTLLAASQIVSFFGYFYHYRSALLPDFRSPAPAAPRT